MELSFREKMQWLTIAAMVTVYGYYFARVLPPTGPDISGSHIALFVSLLLALIVLFIVGTTVLAIYLRRESFIEDERDRLVQLRATRNGHYVLASGAVLAIVSALVTQGNFWFVHILFAFMVLAQLVESASNLVYYRRGV